MAESGEGDRWQNTGKDSREVGMQSGPSMALAQAAAAVDPGDGSTVGWSLADLKSAIKRCNSFKCMGVVLAWWLIAGRSVPFLDQVVAEFTRPWIVLVAKHKSAHSRRRGVTFPLRRGELHELVEVFAASSLASLAVETSANLWGSKAWAYLTMGALNHLAGFSARLEPGRWTAPELSVFSSVLLASERRCASDVAYFTCEEDAWQKEISSKKVGYNGEELTTCHQLTWEQVLPALPPEEHGGCINCLDWVGPRTKEFLTDPSKLLKHEDDVTLPKMPGRIHIRESDKMRIAAELVRRNVCCWIPLDRVYSVKGVRILNGMFGVAKPSQLGDGRPILRVIMNLTGSNETQLQLEGGCSSLPAITSWQSIILDSGEQLSLHQSDMCSAFYLFRIPSVWQRHLAFNILAPGETVGGIPGRSYALACSVIPMGWLNSVGVMQEISERLLSVGLGAEHRLARGYALPPWMNAILDHANEKGRCWWHVYLDNYACGERMLLSESGESAQLFHMAAEAAWSSAGVVSSAKKRISGATRITELGAEIDGQLGMLGVSTEKLLKIMVGTLWMVSQKFLDRKTVQVMAGRWVFVLQFRRPAMSCLQRTWEYIGGKAKMGATLREAVKREFMSLVFLAPLLHCNLAAGVCPHVICTDASETGGSLETSSKLTEVGLDFLQASEKLEYQRSTTVAPILIVSLFNGIGGSFRCYDLAGITPMGRIAAELDDAGNRITQRRWPGTIIVKDVKDITRKQVQIWSRKFLEIEEIHIWAGWPCVDLSAVKFGRQNLQGPQSSLFWEIPRVKQLFTGEFGEHVQVKHVLENVASMDESAASEISNEMGTLPYKLDCADAVPMRRPRFAWTSEKLEGCLTGITVENKRYWKEVHAPASYPSTEQWITEGYQWLGESTGAIFPTCLKSIPRNAPPPKPAGLEKTDGATRERWRLDSFRYPPYQYDQRFLITSESSWRLLNATEKELLLGYGFEHTRLAWSTSKAKQNKLGFSDCRHRLLGDSFSWFSFVILAVACSLRHLPQLAYSHLASRMGMAPGFCAHIRSVAPLQRRLCYGTASVEEKYRDNGIGLLNRMLLRRTNHTGSDIRVLTGEIFNSKTFPRESVSSSWWTWSHGFDTKWKQRSHINVLELEMILLGVKFQISRFHARDMRIFQLTDSYIGLSVTSKGRTSSKQLTRVLNSISAHLLGHGLQLVLGHLDSGDNPADEGSRR